MLKDFTNEAKIGIAVISDEVKEINPGGCEEQD
jgi:hypothetical protein